MKVLIDIPKEVLEHPHNYCCYALANQIKRDYKPIPNNATNGDVIKALFPMENMEQMETKYTFLELVVMVVGYLIYVGGTHHIREKRSRK